MSNHMTLSFETCFTVELSTVGLFHFQVFCDECARIGFLLIWFLKKQPTFVSHDVFLSLMFKLNQCPSRDWSFNEGLSGK